MVYTPVPADKSLPPVRINMLSDTQTKPTPAMREAIARAEAVSYTHLTLPTNREV